MFGFSSFRSGYENPNLNSSPSVYLREAVWLYALKENQEMLEGEWIGVAFYPITSQMISFRLRIPDNAGIGLMVWINLFEALDLRKGRNQQACAKRW